MMNMMLAPAAFLALLLLLLFTTPLGVLCVTCLHVVAQGAAVLSVGGVASLSLAAQGAAVRLGNLPAQGRGVVAPTLSLKARQP